MNPTKTIITGLVMEPNEHGRIQIDGCADQDAPEIGRTWPDKPVHVKSTIHPEGRLLSYVGRRVRITIEAL